MQSVHWTAGGRAVVAGAATRAAALAAALLSTGCEARTLAPVVRSCGDGALDQGETCEPGLTVSGACAEIPGYLGGSYACRPDCTPDLSGCNRVPAVPVPRLPAQCAYVRAPAALWFRWDEPAPDTSAWTLWTTGELYFEVAWQVEQMEPAGGGSGAPPLGPGGALLDPGPCEKGKSAPCYAPNAFYGPVEAVAAGLSTAPPVGARVLWNVRACTIERGVGSGAEGAQCSDWSPPRRVHVGRSPHDLDGDAYADVVPPNPSEPGPLRVLRGGPGLDATEDWSLGDDRNWSLAGAVDFDGDGFGDRLGVGGPLMPLPGPIEGPTMLFRGGVDPEASPPVELGDEALQSVGDLDGDCLGDVASASGTVYLGTAGAPVPYGTIPRGVLDDGWPIRPVWRPGTDVDRDGYADLVAVDERAGGAWLVVYRGGDPLDLAAPPLETPLDSGGFVEHLGDWTDDGFADVAVDDRLLAGGTAGLEWLGPPLDLERPRYAGDVNCDGIDDIFAGGRLFTGAREAADRTEALAFPTPHVGGVGDVDGDGCDDFGWATGVCLAIGLGSASGPLEADPVLCFTP